MDREGAETCLRRLAEAELRRARAPGTLAADGTGRLQLVAYALIAAGAIEVGTADEIQAGLEFALATRPPGETGVTPQRSARLARIWPRRDRTGVPAAPRPASWRVVPVGQVFRIRDGEFRGDLGLLAYLQTGYGARLTMAGWMHGPAPDPDTSRPRLLLAYVSFSAVDDQATGYTLGFGTRLTGPGAVSGVLNLDPQHEIRWLDLGTAPGEPATRIRLDQRVPSPDITVTGTAASPGELLADVIAARMLALASAYPQESPEQLAAAEPGLLPHATGWLGDVVTALLAAAALPPSSPVPGQLAGLCGRLGISGHGITTPPAADLPERWTSMLSRYHRRSPRPLPAPGSWAAIVAELPVLDGVRLAVLGLHHSERGTVLYLHAGGVTMEDDWAYYRAVSPLPNLWIRDSAGRWHATDHYAPRPLGDDGEVTLSLAIVPPLEAATAWIDVVTIGQSAQVRARLPVRWTWNP